MALPALLDKMTFKSNEVQPEFDLVRQSFSMGANLTVTTSREHQFIVGESLPAYTNGVLETFSNIVQRHKFHPLELNAAIKQYQHENKERESNMEQVVLDAVHQAAYLDNSFGRPIHARNSSLHKFDSKALREWQRSFYSPKRMIVGGVGVDHESFVQQVRQVFDSLPKDTIPLDSAEKPRYTGGEVRMDRRHSDKEEDRMTHLAIGFETASWLHKDVVAMCVLQVLMGGGGSFSAGGPGKGMYSRLYRHVLNQHHFFENATCFNSIFKDSGLFGVYGVSAPEHATSMAEVLVTELIRMTADIEQVELDRAKNQLKSSVFMQLETRNTILEDICRQLSVFGKVESAETVASWVDQVTIADVQNVAKTMLKTAPSIACVGDLRNVPRYDQIANVISQNI